MAMAIQSGDKTDELAFQGGLMAAWRIKFAKLTWGALARADFYDQLAILLDAGEGEMGALTEIWQIVTNRGKWSAFIFTLVNPILVAVPVWLNACLGGGESDQVRSLDRVIGEWLPRTEAGLLTAYYKRGLSSQHLYDLAADVRLEASWFRRIQSGLAPLGLAALIIGGISYLAGTVFFPSLLRSMPNTHLTGQALLAKQMSDFMIADGPLVLVVAIAIPLLVWLSMSRWTGKVRAIVDHVVWPYTIYREYTGTKWLKSVAPLVDAGEDAHAAVGSMQETSTPYMKERILEIVVRDNMLVGEALSDCGLMWPDSATISFITIAQRASHPGAVLRAIADRRMVLLSEKMAKMASHSEMAGTLVVGLFVLWITMVSNDLAALTTTMH